MSEFEITESARQSMAGFEGVWTRVTGGAGGTASPAVCEEDALQNFIKSELCACAFDGALARMFQAPGRVVLLNHASGAKLRARRLKAEYFIRTGVSYTPMDSCQPVTGKLASLRTALERDMAAGQAYTAAAEKTSVPELRELYLCFAKETEAAARETRNLILECF